GVEPRFVDIHSHVVPSGDDGVQSVSEGLSLGRDAFEHRTRVLYATPHVGPHVPPFDESRERRIRTAFRELRERLPLELRLGFELTPMPSLLGDDPWRFVLEGTELVLVEIPFVGSAEPTNGISTSTSSVPSRTNRHGSSPSREGIGVSSNPSRSSSGKRSRSSRNAVRMRRSRLSSNGGTCGPTCGVAYRTRVRCSKASRPRDRPSDTDCTPSSPEGTTCEWMSTKRGSTPPP